MRILVLGAGGTGGYFGGRLAEAGVDVTFLVRSRRAAQLRADGLVLTSRLGNMRQPVKFVERGDTGTGWDLVLLACKAYDLADAIETISSAVTASTRILPLLNGVRHLGVLGSRFGLQSVLGGLCHIGVRMASDGTIEHLNEIQHFAYGQRTHEQRAFCDALEPILAAGRFSPIRSQDILQDMWEKWMMLSTYAAMTCLFRGSIGDIVASGGRPYVEQALDEAVKVAAAHGHAPRPQFLAETYATLTEDGSKNTSSMLRDVRAGNRIEVEQVLADFVNSGARLDLPCPLLSLAVVQLRAYERQRSASS